MTEPRPVEKPERYDSIEQLTVDVGEAQNSNRSLILQANQHP
jgi:hypothetical protein